MICSLHCLRINYFDLLILDVVEGLREGGKERRRKGGREDLETFSADVGWRRVGEK